MWEIETPDDAGGIGKSPSLHPSLFYDHRHPFLKRIIRTLTLKDIDTIVSFIVIPAKKGFQAAAVTIADPPQKEDAGLVNDPPLENAMEEMHVTDLNENTATDGGWGNGVAESEVTTNGTAGGEWGNDVSGTDNTATDTAGEDWGSGGW